MKAAVVKRMGCIAALHRLPDPRPRDGGVVATVEASALTNLTRGLVSGKHYASKEIHSSQRCPASTESPASTMAAGSTPARWRPTG